MEDDSILAGRFWTSHRILLALIFATGLIIGGVITNQLVDPIIYSKQLSDYNSLSELNSRLDSRNDQLYSCIVKSNLDPEKCVPKK